MVQRLGRVIRKKADGRPGRLVVLYSKGTVEDPDVQGEEFLGKVLPFARNVGFFDIRTDQDGLQHAHHPDRLAQRHQAVFVELVTGLVAVGLDAGHRQLTQVAPRGAHELGGDQGADAPSEATATTRHR